MKRNKKLLSVLLALVLLTGLLPLGSVTAYADGAYSITVDAGANGSAAADADTADEGAVVTLTVTPEEGYELDALTVTDTENNSVAVTGYSFTMPASDVTVSVTFKEIPASTTYSVTVNAAEGGTVTASPTSAAAGAVITLTVTPEEDYELDTLTVTDADNNSVTVTSDSFTMPESNVTVNATFKKTAVSNTLTITFDANGGTPGANWADQYELPEETSYTLPEVNDSLVLAPAGMTFDAYEIDGSRYEAGAAITPNGDVTVKFLWKTLISKYNVWVGSTQLTDDNKDDIFGNGTARYNPTTHTLTLNNAAISGQYNGAMIYAEGQDLILQASSQTLNCDGNDQTWAILVRNGSLTVNGSVTATGGAYGFYASQDISITGGTVIAAGDSKGLYAPNGGISVSNDVTRVTVDGKEAIVAGTGLSLGSLVRILEPAGGALSEDKSTVLTAAGEIAGHVVLGPAEELPKVIGVKLRGSGTEPDSEGRYRLKTEVLEPIFDSGSAEVSISITPLSTDEDNSSPLTAAPEPCTSCYFLVNLAAGSEGSPTVYWDDAIETGCDASAENAAVEFVRLSRSPGGSTAQLLFRYTENKAPVPVSYTVSFDSDGGSAVASQTVERGGKAVKPADPTRSGYSFVAWYVDAANGGVFDFSSPIEGDVKLKARWKENEAPAPATFTVYFDSGDGSGSMSPVELSKADAPYEYTLPNSGFLPPPGEVFDSWTLEGTSLRLLPGQKVMLSGADITFRAQWVLFDESPAHDGATYKITAGAGGSWIRGSGKTYELVVKRSLDDAHCIDHFTGVQIDGKTLTVLTDYTVESGSTLVKLRASYLEKLSRGSHTVTIFFDDGSVQTKFAVRARKGVPTGDDSEPGFWLGVMILSACGIFVAMTPFWMCRRRRN